MNIIRIDQWRLARAARQLLRHDTRTPEERRLGELAPVPSIQSLTEIDRRPSLWTCAGCSHVVHAGRSTCWYCGAARGASPAVSS